MHSPGNDRWQTLGFAMVIVAVCAVSERIGVNEGVGWDGKTYARWARDLPSVRHGLNSYGAQRIMPSAIVYSGLRLGRFPTTTRNVISGFIILDALATIMALLAWRHAAISVGLGPAARIFGMIALIGNFAVLKWIPYNPVLTDAFAFMLGALMLACWASGKPLALLGMSLVGAFTWPALLLPSFILVLCPRRSVLVASSRGEVRTGALLAAASALAVFGVLMVIAAAGPAAFNAPETAAWVSARLQLMRPLGLATSVSAVLLAAAAFLSTRPLWTMLVTARSWEGFRKGLFVRVLAVAAVYVATSLAVSQMTDLRARGPWDYLATVVFTALRFPLVSFVAHTAFYGPVILLAALEWRAVCDAIGRQGPGMVLCALLGLVLALDAESRHVLPLLPLLACFTAKGLEDLGWTRGRLIALAGLAVLLSKIWLPIGPLPQGPSSHGIANWETERFTMNIGFRMSQRMYLIQAGLTALVTALLWRLLARSRSGSAKE